MTNATKSLFVIFVTLAAATLLHVAFGGKSVSKAFSAAVVQFDSTKIDRILIEQPAKPAVELKLEGKIWNVVLAEGKTFPADRQTVMNSLGELTGMKIKALATRDAEKFGRFQVDSTGTTVRVFSSGKEKAAVVLGKFNFVSRSEFNTYVRNAASNEVFAVEGFISSTFNREADNWRDKKVWEIREDAIRQIELIFPGDSSWAAFKADGNKWISVSDTLDDFKSGQLVRQVTSISATQFDDAISPAEVSGSPKYTIKVSLDNGTARELMLIQHPDDGAYYRATADNYPYVFRLSRSSLDGSVLKSRKSFLEK